MTEAQVETNTMNQSEMGQPSTSIKIQNKITNFIEQNTSYSVVRSEFIQLNKGYRKLSKSKKPQDVQQVVQKTYVDSEGKEVTISQMVKRREYPTKEVEDLYTDLKKKRKEILRFSKPATLYLNLLVDRIIQDFIDSCEPLQVGKKSQEKTFGWKQFNRQRFSHTLSFSLVHSSKYFNDFLTMKNLIKQFEFDKESQRLKQGQTKAESTTFQQDIQRYKFLVTKQPEKSPEEIQSQIEEEFGLLWSKHTGCIYNMLERLQSDDEYAKFLFNTVKNVTRVYHDKKSYSSGNLPELAEEDQKRVKISNGFKNMIAKMIREMLVSLAYKVQVYLEGQSNHQIKLSDIKKIVQLWVSMDSVEDMKRHFSEFDGLVDSRLKEIDQLKKYMKEQQAETAELAEMVGETPSVSSSTTQPVVLSQTPSEPAVVSAPVTVPTEPTPSSEKRKGKKH